MRGRVVVAAGTHAVTDEHDPRRLDAEPVGQRSHRIRLVEAGGRNVDARVPARTHLQMRQVGGHRRGQTHFLGVARVPSLLGLGRGELAQRRKGDLAAAVLDPRPPGGLVPHALLLGVPAQRVDGAPLVLLAQLVRVHARPIRAVPPIVAGAAGGHQMQVGAIRAFPEHVEDLADDQLVPASRDDRDGDQAGQAGDTVGHRRVHRLLGAGERVVQVEPEHAHGRDQPVVIGISP